jgi:ADP-ribosylglycohydrolase
VIVTSGDGAVLVTFGRGARTETLSCADVLAEPSLAAFAKTFTLRERRMPAPSGVRIRGWAAALAEKAVRPRAAGALLGLAVGDALGTTNEFKFLQGPAFPELATAPVDDVVGGGPFKLVAGQVTDDTQMAAVIAERFLASDLFVAGDLAKGYLAWRDVAFDVGVQITQVLDQIASGTAADKAGRAVWEARDRFPAGNGSLMRTAVIGVLLAGMDAETRRRATFIDSTITHFDPRCVLACAAFNAAIAHALTEKPSPSSMLRAASAELPEAAAQLRLHYGDIASEIEAARTALAGDLEAARDDDPQLYGEELHLHKGAGFVRVAFRLAFWELLHAPDYRAAVVDAANRGGDADTNAAIVGAVLGAFHGIDSIPPGWREKVLAAPGLRAGSLDLHPRAFVRALERAYGA